MREEEEGGGGVYLYFLYSYIYNKGVNLWPEVKERKVASYKMFTNIHRQTTGNGNIEENIPDIHECQRY